MKYKVIKELKYLKSGINTTLFVNQIIDSSEDGSFANYRQFFLDNQSIIALSDNNIKHITSIVPQQEQPDAKDDEVVADAIVEDEQSVVQNDEVVADAIVEDEQSVVQNDEVVADAIVEDEQSVVQNDVEDSKVQQRTNKMFNKMFNKGKNK
jgi:hypothetical protein